MELLNNFTEQNNSPSLPSQLLSGKDSFNLRGHHVKDLEEGIATVAVPLYIQCFILVPLLYSRPMKQNYDYLSILQ